MGNEITHFIGVPLIVFAVQALLVRVRVMEIAGFPIDLGLVAVLVMGAAYAALSVPLAAVATAVALGIWWAARASVAMGPLAAVAIFILGWIFQLVGHGVYEKQSPSFTKNLVHLAIGPIWLLNLIVRAVPTGLEAPES